MNEDVVGPLLMGSVLVGIFVGLFADWFTSTRAIIGLTAACMLGLSFIMYESVVEEPREVLSEVIGSLAFFAVIPFSVAATLSMLGAQIHLLLGVGAGVASFFLGAGASIAVLSIAEFSEYTYL